MRSNGGKYNTAITDIPVWENRFLRGVPSLYIGCSSKTLFDSDKVSMSERQIYLTPLGKTDPVPNLKRYTSINQSKKINT